ncbi:hypothetical protein [Acinetobacter johnsonii]|uniref:Uncharacterized protein n=1 Tax=Acinetobacter johnsonii TaxID=40214 RepID=A0AAW6RQM5_ACIJO|nr:hypothetical protein [Acinetobacter johnsonii]MDG9785885.1 hypothetical protein [Acinetobacter johnsonii]MDG9797856.1 hypothetical protein [Acinetobacter johnsonii]
MSIFTTEHAARLMNKMKAFYGKKYAEQWGDIPAADIADAMVECLQGLNQEDFKRGYMRMQRSTFCPTIPEFRSWCEPKTDDWLGSHEAWAIAEKSIGFDGQELTVIWTEQMAHAFSRCEDLVKTGDKYQRAEAKKIFCDAYDRLVTQAKDQGLKPIYVTSLGTDKDQQIAAINQATVDGFLTAPDATALLEHKQTKLEQLSESERYKTIAQEALAKLGPLIKRNPINRMTEEHKEPQPWESIEDEHIDPFDNFEEYKAALRAEQKQLPNAVRFMDKQVGGGV